MDTTPPNSEAKSIEYVLLEDLRFDPSNPRLPKNIDGTDQRAVLTWMLQEEGVIELMGAIGETGYFPGEPLLTAPAKGDGTKYAVVEGNRRLAALMLLRDPSSAPIRVKAVAAAAEQAAHHPEEVPIIKYDDRQEVLEFLGFRHITGIKQWDSLEKARYLSQLYERTPGNDSLQRHQALARTIGSRADYVARLLSGLAVYEEIENHGFFGIPSLTLGTMDFSVLTTALNYRAISAYVGLAGRGDTDTSQIDLNRLEELTKWMFAENSEGITRLGESRNLRLLAPVVETPDALERFRGGLPLAEAAMLTEAPHEVFRKALFDARSRLRSAYDYAPHVHAPEKSDLATVEELWSLVRSLKGVVEGALRDVTEA
ncbi:MAG TPA: hypothetical protein VFE05_04155 [Longimicrobiaceae bacterium]|jgi:hypothetical protein|nr:hypothetical protein [Longimicrobiaceae bacterium]